MLKLKNIVALIMLAVVGGVKAQPPVLPRFVAVYGDDTCYHGLCPMATLPGTGFNGYSPIDVERWIIAEVGEDDGVLRAYEKKLHTQRESICFGPLMGIIPAGKTLFEMHGDISPDYAPAVFLFLKITHRQQRAASRLLQRCIRRNIAQTELSVMRAKYDQAQEDACSIIDGAIQDLVIKKVASDMASETKGCALFLAQAQLKMSQQRLKAQQKLLCFDSAKK